MNRILTVSLKRTDSHEGSEFAPFGASFPAFVLALALALASLSRAFASTAPAPNALDPAAWQRALPNARRALEDGLLGVLIRGLARGFLARIALVADTNAGPAVISSVFCWHRE